MVSFLSTSPLKSFHHYPRTVLPTSYLKVLPTLSLSVLRPPSPLKIQPTPNTILDGFLAPTMTMSSPDLERVRMGSTFQAVFRPASPFELLVCDALSTVYSDSYNLVKDRVYIPCGWTWHATLPPALATRSTLTHNIAKITPIYVQGVPEKIAPCIGLPTHFATVYVTESCSFLQHVQKEIYQPSSCSIEDLCICTTPVI